VQVDSIRTRVQGAYDFSSWNYIMMNCFRLQLSISTCAATLWRRSAWPTARVHTKTTRRNTSHKAGVIQCGAARRGHHPASQKTHTYK